YLYTGNSGLTISTASTNGDAGNITVVANANFTDNGTNVVINGTNDNNGFIDFASNAISTLDARSTAGKGGTVNLIAYSGPINGGGFVQYPAGITAYTGGSKVANGDFNIVAGATSLTAIFGGSIDTSGGGAAGTGNISLITANPASGIQ